MELWLGSALGSAADLTTVADDMLRPVGTVVEHGESVIYRHMARSVLISIVATSALALAAPVGGVGATGSL